MRNIPICPEAPEIRYPETSGVCSESYDIRVITPLFGGGAMIHKIDPVTVVRPSSVRGCLRFWWRATKGADCPNADRLRERETEIWGSTKKTSPVALQDLVTTADSTSNDFGGERGLTYALFPFTPDPKKPKYSADTCRQGVEFRLSLTFPDDFREDVHAALWAWINFGGIGSRTRRGCGALHNPMFSPSDHCSSQKAIAQWYQEKLREYNIRVLESPQEWPTMPSSILCHYRTFETSREAWKEGIAALRDFRQGNDPPVGRNLGERVPETGRLHPGRSRWPEPDSLRRITSCSKKGHETSITTLTDAFPRAEFGLPIVFQFPEREKEEPPKSVLYPEKSRGKRMSSPLIIRPLPVGDKRAMAMILRLNTAPLLGARLEGKSKEGKSMEKVVDHTQIRNPEFATYRNSPIENRSKIGSALEAFVIFVQERWRTHG